MSKPRKANPFLMDAANGSEDEIANINAQSVAWLHGWDDAYFDAIEDDDQEEPTDSLA